MQLWVDESKCLFLISIFLLLIQSSSAWTPTSSDAYGVNIMPVRFVYMRSGWAFVCSVDRCGRLKIRFTIQRGIFPSSVTVMRIKMLHINQRFVSLQTGTQAVRTHCFRRTIELTPYRQPQMRFCKMGFGAPSWQVPGYNLGLWRRFNSSKRNQELKRL